VATISNVSGTPPLVSLRRANAGRDKDIFEECFAHHTQTASITLPRRLTMRTTTQALALLVFLGAAYTARGQSLEVPMQLLNGDTKSIGTITVTSAEEGVTFAPNLTNLPPGTHGFHVHERPSCDAAPDPQSGKLTQGQAAGGHLDPEKTNRHEGPAGKGHTGDLPALNVDPDGNATTPVNATRLKISDLQGHALVIHAGGDNYSDSPQKLGGGGPRIACGVIR
jgi:superoxide dismutase, Cu-Zn family